jgi:hypothetical protein
MMEYDGFPSVDVPETVRVHLLAQAVEFDALGDQLMAEAKSLRPTTLDEHSPGVSVMPGAFGGNGSTDMSEVRGGFVTP